MKTISFGIIGGGLMGREAASAFARWFVLNDFPIKVELKAVCDINESALSWYKQIPTIELLTTDYKELLACPDIDVIYIAVPHNLHKKYYLEILRSGKDLFGEKPFGIDMEAAMAIKDEAEKLNRFARCSSEMPFLPGAQRVIEEIKSGRLGEIIEVNAGFLHSSDMNPEKPINWKRQSEFCGEIGVMGDLGIHVLHIPLRMGWKPNYVFSVLQKIITQRPDGKGGMVESDTWNNATLNTSIKINHKNIPMNLEMKRLSPGETNTWYIEVLGTKGGIKYSTKNTKTIWLYEAGSEQGWKRVDLGFQVAFPTVTGGIFEPGFPDCFMQMFATFVAEREGFLHNKFGCVKLEEVVETHRLFSAALKSNQYKTTEKL